MSDETGTFAPANGATVTIDIETARLIRNAFVPRNPRKMRNCDERVRQAALRFIEAVEHVEAGASMPLPSANEGALK